MFRLWLTLRQLRLRATPRFEERGAVEAYLRAKGAFGITNAPFFSFARTVSLAAVMVLVLSVSVSSYAYASDEVLPDTPLYPVRQALEEVQVRLALSPVQKQEVHKKLAARRVKEVKKLKELKRPIPAKLRKFLEVSTNATTTRMFERANEKEHVTNDKNGIDRLRLRQERRLNERTTFNSSSPTSTDSVRQRDQDKGEAKQERRNLRRQRHEQRLQERENKSRGQ